MKNQYTIDKEEYFENLTQLVEYYKHDADGLVTNLKEHVAQVGGKVASKMCASSDQEKSIFSRS